jgi:hypothetical protein
MNYFIQNKIESAGEKIKGQQLTLGINDLKVYLLSEKFWKDTTVQVSDVLRRLDEIMSNAEAAEEDYKNEAYATVRQHEEENRAKGKANCGQCAAFGYNWKAYEWKGQIYILCSRCQRTGNGPLIVSEGKEVPQ